MGRVAGENKRFAINLFSSVLAFAVNFGVGFFLTPYLINSVGATAYSFVPIANNFVSYISIATVALNSMASRFITIQINSGNDEEANVYFNSVLVSNLILSAVLTLPAVVFTFCVNRFMDVPDAVLTDVQWTFAFVFLNMMISLVFNVFGVATFCKNRLDLSSVRAIQGNIIRAVMLVLLFMCLTPKIYYITLTAIVVTVYSVITNMVYTRRLLPQVKVNIRQFSRAAVKTLISSGVWNSVNQLSVVLMTTLDLWMMNSLVSASAGGEYAIVKTLPNFIQSLVATVTSVFVPKFTILYAQKKFPEMMSSIKGSIRFMGFVMTLPIAFLLIFGDTFFSLWVPGQDIGKLQILSIMTLIPMLVTSCINPIYNVYTVTNKLKTPALVWLGFGVTNVLMVIMLITVGDMGIYAIPFVAMLMGIIRNLGFTPIYASYCLKIKKTEFYRSILQGLLCAGVMCVICLIYKHLVPVGTWFQLILAAAVCAILAFAVNVLLFLSAAEKRSALAAISGKLDKLKRKS